MSRKGNCWDNAVAESFFGSLKKERIKKQIYKNRELAIERCGRLHRGVLQSNPPPQSSRRREPRAVRSGSETRGDGVSTESWELHLFLARDVFTSGEAVALMKRRAGADQTVPSLNELANV